MYNIGDDVKVKSVAELEKMGYPGRTAMALGGKILTLDSYNEKLDLWFSNSVNGCGFHEEAIEHKIGNYPQQQESDECRQFLLPGIVDQMLKVAKEFTSGAERHPNETWRQIPTEEHLQRAFRHILQYCAGDRSEDHISHIIIRAFMAGAVEESKMECFFDPEDIRRGKYGFTESYDEAEDEAIKAIKQEGLDEMY